MPFPWKYLWKIHIFLQVVSLSLLSTCKWAGLSGNPIATNQTINLQPTNQAGMTISLRKSGFFYHRLHHWVPSASLHMTNTFNSIAWQYRLLSLSHLLMSSESISPTDCGIVVIVIRISLSNNGGGASWNEWEEICCPKFLDQLVMSCRASTWLTEQSLKTSPWNIILQHDRNNLLEKQIQMILLKKNKCVSCWRVLDLFPCLY